MILIFKTKKIDHCEERVVKCNTVMQFKMQWKPLNLLSEKEKKRERESWGFWAAQNKCIGPEENWNEILSELVSVCCFSLTICVYIYMLCVLWQINFDFFFFLMTSNKRRNLILALILSLVYPLTRHRHTLQKKRWLC